MTEEQPPVPEPVKLELNQPVEVGGHVFQIMKISIENEISQDSDGRYVAFRLEIRGFSALKLEAPKTEKPKLIAFPKRLRKKR